MTYERLKLIVCDIALGLFIAIAGLLTLTLFAVLMAAITQNIWIQFV